MGRLPISPATSFGALASLEHFADMSSRIAASGEVHHGFGPDYSRYHAALPVEGMSSFAPNLQELTPPVSHSLTRRWAKANNGPPRLGIPGQIPPPAESMAPTRAREATQATYVAAAEERRRGADGLHRHIHHIRQKCHRWQLSTMSSQPAAG